jgi:hypothetical protein
MNVVVNNQEKFQTNSGVTSVNTRNKYHLLDQLPMSQTFRKLRMMLMSKYTKVNHLNSQVLRTERLSLNPFILLRNLKCSEVTHNEIDQCI